MNLEFSIDMHSFLFIFQCSDLDLTFELERLCIQETGSAIRFLNTLQKAKLDVGHQILYILYYHHRGIRSHFKHEILIIKKFPNPLHHVLSLDQNR